MLKGTAREAAAEFFGTFILIAFGVGVVAQTVLSKDANGSFLAINIGWGLAVMLGIYVAGGRVGRAPESGGHGGAGRAPRRSRGARCCRTRSRRSPARLPASARGVRRPIARRSRAFDGGMRMVEGATATAGIFATYPQPFLSIAGGFVDQVVGTMLLMAGVLAVTDQKNVGAPAWLHRSAGRRAGGRDRRRVWLQRRLRDQPGARLRPAALHVRGGLGIGRVHRRRRMVVGAGRRRRSSARSSARGSTTLFVNKHHVAPEAGR